MLLASIGRFILAVLAGYTGNAVLVAASEQLLPRLIPNPDYFVADLITQCLYEVAGGYLCCLIAKRSERWIAVVGLVGLGLLVGTISLVTSWKAEPHWYGIALLSVWVPCV
jgi:peptidoglycan/LPS O-acetylase OafA/YrhL